MKEAILIFWKYLNNLSEEEDIDLDYWLEENEVDISTITDNSSDEELEDFFYNLISTYMDATGNDNYGDVFELLCEITELEPQRIADILDAEIDVDDIS